MTDLANSFAEPAAPCELIEQIEGNQAASKVASRGKNAFSRFPNAVTRDPRVGPALLVLLAYRTTYVDQRKPYALNERVLLRNPIVRPSTGLGANNIRAAFAEAAQLGLLERKQSGPVIGGKWPKATETLNLPPAVQQDWIIVRRDWFDRSVSLSVSLKAMAVWFYCRAGTGKGPRIYAREIADRFGWAERTTRVVIKEMLETRLLERRVARDQAGRISSTTYAPLEAEKWVGASTRQKPCSGLPCNGSPCDGSPCDGSRGNIRKDSPHGDLSKKRDQSPLQNPLPPEGGDGRISDAISEAFETWWTAYPQSVHKVAKAEALSLFRQAVTGKRRAGKRGRKDLFDHGLTTPEVLVAAVKIYAMTEPDPKYVPAPCTWLNQGRWLDAADNPWGSPLGKVGPNGKPWGWWGDKKSSSLYPEVWRNGVIKVDPNGPWPWWNLGAPPGHPECIVHPDVLAEFGLVEIYGGRVRPER